MKTLRQSFFLPIFALIAFLGFGAGTVLADSSSEGVGGWTSEAVGAGQATFSVPGNLFGIDGSGDVRFTSRATGSEPKRRAFVGTLTRGPVTRTTDETTGITLETVASFTVDLQTSGELESVDIGLPTAVTILEGGRVDSPIIRTPGGPRAGTFEDGARVVVLAQETEEGGREALWILVKPVKPNAPVHGVVVAVDGDEVTIETSDGDKKTVTLPEHARGVGPGEVVTVFQGNSGKAKGLVRAETVRNRLKKFLDDAEEAVAEPEEDEHGQGNKHDKEAAHAERIANFLERFNERQTRLLDRVIDRAPERVKVRLAQVRERIQAQRLEHRDAIERIRTKLDRIHPVHSHRGGAETADRPRPEKVDQNQGGEHPVFDDGPGGRLRSQGGSTDTP